MAGKGTEAGRRLHISTEILTCVLFLRECVISHAHQVPFHTIFGFRFWVRGIKVNWGFGLRLESFLSSSDSVDCLCCFLLQPALQALANLLTQETGPPGRLSVIKFYLLSLCNFPSFFLSLFFLNLAAVSSRMNPSLIARGICLACFNNLNLLGLEFLRQT